MTSPLALFLFLFTHETKHKHKHKEMALKLCIKFIHSLGALDSTWCTWTFFSFFPLHFFIGRKNASYKMPNFPFETSTDESFFITQLSRLLRSAGETFALLVSSRCWREMASAWTASECFLLAIARQDRYENKYNSTGFFFRPSREDN